MPLIHADAIILQTFAYSETSKILRLFTRTHGLISAIARGALRPKSRYGGVLEQFTEGVATLYVKEGRELQNLSGFELIRSHQSLGRDLIRFGGASVMAELILRTIMEQADTDLYDAVRNGLARIEAADAADLESILLADLWALTCELGFAPVLTSCVGCGRPLGDDEPATFDYDAGGVRCESCSVSGAGRELPTDARRALVALNRGEAVSLERTAAHWALLSRFLSHHVVEGTPLKALVFLAEALQAEPCAP
jgi:DNA repair protein RecO (recombination protein O)